MIQPNYPKYKIVETLNNKSSEYLLTANDLAMVCPFKQPLPVQNSFGQTGIQMPTCSSMCPHFKISVTSDEDDFLEFWEKKINNESAKIACLEAASFENSTSSYTTP